MGRAPNPGAPQRVSAHVLPNAQVLASVEPVGPVVPADDEDEKTTIESGGWEEEASTTVEQGEVAEKVRALGLAAEARRPNTGITSTTDSGVSEEHTVDEQRGGALALLPPPSLARLVITHGNDVGQALEVRPGKTYTVGRGLDNDLVLTDIAVSRKHFELRCDDGRWVVADRGSGNGTLVNSRIEDAPFTLATGDAIEIGTTTFRFEHPGGSPRIPPGYEGPGPGDVDPEPSTASGEPVETPPQLTPVGRPKTLPPPAPVRTRPPTNRPVPSYPPERPSAPPAVATAPTISPVQSVPAIQLPPPGALASPAMPALTRSPQQPTLLDPLVPSLVPPISSISPTLPGPGAPAHPARLPFSYPTGERPKVPIGMPRRSLSMPVALAPRDGSSTALVRPMAYSNGQPVIAPQPAQFRPAPALTYRMKMALAAVGLALFMAITTIAILKGATGDSTGAELTEPPPATPPPTTTTPPPQSTIAKAAEPPRSPPGRTITPITPDPTTPPLPTTAPKPERAPMTIAPPPPVITTTPRGRTDDAPRPERPTVAAKRPERHSERVDKPERSEKKVAAVKPDNPAPEPEAPPRKHRSLQDLRHDADALYRKKDFNGAAAVLSSAQPAFAGAEAQQLLSTAKAYVQFRSAYNVGMAPATKATDAFVALRQALTYDKDLGGNYTSEIQEKLVGVATRAAVSYMAAHEYESAYLAVRTSDTLGNPGSTIKSVRDKLQQVASDLYRAALNELTTDPDSAKRKLRQILGMVDAKTQVYANASKLLNGS